MPLINKDGENKLMVNRIWLQIFKNTDFMGEEKTQIESLIKVRKLLVFFSCPSSDLWGQKSSTMLSHRPKCFLRETDIFM